MYFKKREEALSCDVPPTGAKVQCDLFRNTNTTKHRTNEYDTDALVLRRGATFKVGMTFEGISFSEIKKAILGLTVEASSVSGKSIQARCPIVDKIDESKWQMQVAEKDANRLYVVVNVNIPSNAIVGRYLLDVILPPSGESLKRYKLVVVFNPWCKADEVYLDNEEERKEYVLNEEGLIFKGNSSNGTKGIKSIKWIYGQFRKNILDCVLLLLEKDKRSQDDPLKTLFKRNSCVWVARILSAMINAHEDDGVIEGKWKGIYEDGTKPPSSWSGSVDILNTYYNNESPVKYGQCWVFAGVFTTALRALGIPSRPVTNFDSGHDSDQTMTIDIFYDQNMVPFPENDNRQKDSFWNFHVWNEIWTTRKDLPGTKYDGWQAVDATPQELSNDRYQVGPAPVAAVKEGEIYVGFDTGFVFAEVNGEYIEWRENGTIEHGLPSKSYERISSQAIGAYISTKKVGADEREDITHLYKYEEGTENERKAFSTAYSFGCGHKDQNFDGLFKVEKDIEELKLYIASDPSGEIANGSNFKGIINVENKCLDQITVDVSVSLNSIWNKGKKIAHLIKSQDFTNVPIRVGETVKLELPVSVQDYINKLTELNTLEMVAVARLKETESVYIKHFQFDLSNAHQISVQFPDQLLDVSRKSEVNVSFSNDLPISLTNLVFTIEGAGLTPPLKESGDVLASGETMTKAFSFTPYKSGTLTFIVDIDSKQVKDIKSSFEVNVQDTSTYANKN